MRHFPLGSAFLAAFAVLWTAAAPTRAITNGLVDTSNTFSNTGAFVVKAPDGQIFPICSGTLIAPGVFLTASHCTSYFEGTLVPQGYTAYVSFDNRSEEHTSELQS